MPGIWMKSVEETELIEAYTNAVGVDEEIVFQSTDWCGKKLVAYTTNSSCITR